MEKSPSQGLVEGAEATNPLLVEAQESSIETKISKIPLSENGSLV